VTAIQRDQFDRTTSSSLNRDDPGADLLEDVAFFLRRFVVLSPAQAVALALWVAHTHAIEAADTTPYPAITSAEKRSGKTRLLETLEVLVHNPVMTMNTSDAALFRSLSAGPSTLLFDETDAIFRARGREDLRGMINAGYHRAGFVLRTGRDQVSIKRFPVFCAKAFAGIGKCLPDTIVDRSISIRLRRRTTAEAIERFRRGDLEETTTELRNRLGAWLHPHVKSLREQRPDLPDALDDRAQDVWEPLFAIADLAGGSWPADARAAALELRAEEEDGSAGVRLLNDLRAVFVGERMTCAELAHALNTLEDANWVVGAAGSELTTRELGWMLKPYAIKARSIRTSEGKRANGYRREQFEDAWARYLPPQVGEPAAGEERQRMSSRDFRRDEAEEADNRHTRGEPDAGLAAAPRASNSRGGRTAVDLPPDAPTWERAWWERRLRK
jgi:hypothetical protein